jgi:hypothetical protein
MKKKAKPTRKKGQRTPTLGPPNPNPNDPAQNPALREAIALSKQGKKRKPSKKAFNPYKPFEK